MNHIGTLAGVLLGAVLLAPVPARAVLTTSTSQGASEVDLAANYSSTDLLQGLIPVELPADRGWHPVNGNPADQLPAFTDGAGVLPSGLTGLLNDFPGAGAPAKSIQYTLGAPSDIGGINVFSGNNGRDGRVFHTYTVEFSSNAGADWTPAIYVQSHASGTINDAAAGWRNVLTMLGDSSGTLATGVTDLRFNLYAASNTQRQMHDPFDGINPFNGVDDGLVAAFESPLIWEIDVFAPSSDVIPEPSSLLLLGSGLGGLLPLLRRKH